MLYWLLKSVLLGPLMRAVFRPSVEGLEHVPSTGPAILASNHLSFSDSFFLPLVVPRRITFLAKSDYFTGRGIKGRLTAGFFRGVGQVPVDRAGGSASEGALDAGLRVLRAGQLLGIYPEGTRSPDGKLYRGRTGMARMALEADCVVLPVAMIGTDKVQPTGQKIPNLGRVGILIGAPLDFSRYRGQEDDRLVLRAITDEVMTALQALSKQEYVPDVYASTVKEQLAEAVKERIAQARVRAQTAAASASSAAAEARAKVEDARVRVDATMVEAKAKVDDAKAKVDASVHETRAKLDASLQEAKAKVDAGVQEAKAKVDAGVQEAMARVDAGVQEAKAKVDARRTRPDADGAGSDVADLPSRPAAEPAQPEQPHPASEVDRPGQAAS